jgi:hypothetical protein
MTNSGRETDMAQYSFASLKNVFEANGWSFDIFWEKIEEAARSVMEIYGNRISGAEMITTALFPGRLGIPKILGLDFVVDSERVPWLVEVNRFPGLEARGDGDRDIKNKVLASTWRLASKKLELVNADIDAIFGTLLDKSTEERDASCLVRIL